MLRLKKWQMTEHTGKRLKPITEEKQGMQRLQDIFMGKIDENDIETYEYVQCHGIVSGHYRLADGTYIHTSEVESAYMEDKGKYVVETSSGSVYHLNLKDINKGERDMTLNILEKLVSLSGKDEEMMKETVSKEKQLKDRRKIITDAKKWAENNMNEGELYLIIDECTIEVIKALFKGKSGVREIGANVHIGTFQDSVLITDFEKGEVDFRYFQKCFGLQPYVWSGGLAGVYVYNMGDDDFIFDVDSGGVTCKAEEVTKIVREQYTCEDLVGHDSVDGKISSGAKAGNDSGEAR